MLGDRIILKLLPKNYVKLLKNFAILSEKYGQRKSINLSKCIDANDEEIPWYTYPAIECLQGIEFSQCKVLEFGSGSSSVWWSKRAAKVLSVEHDENWFKKTSQYASKNLSVVCAVDKQTYITTGKGEKFEIIIIDGLHRYECAETCFDSLSEDGLIILDNSDWYPDLSKYLREQCGLLEVDFHGFGPINNYTWTTSLFYKRKFKLTPAENRMPVRSLGALNKIKDSQSK